MAEAGNPLVLDTQQYADDIGLAKAFTRAINTGQKFLRGDGPGIEFLVLAQQGLAFFADDGLLELCIDLADGRASDARP